ncbi:MAG: hypothetical protein AVDCRST_MAG59-1141 [uncultured Thermomicrobiales bacterium]|uniref:Uncharacterized protein n=1 Tax=uncultured Thermomicrobiales bacterium TaxID=1645740 RepID=A0A6J4UC79_9BACT|nr:MAG: hypothetical protein AVDCRST_MAG59-1141 [uncultured Thermomicrobiales bacterium]
MPAAGWGRLRRSTEAVAARSPGKRLFQEEHRLPPSRTMPIGKNPARSW